MTIDLKRAYDPPAKSDGRRILVDRVWPRGIAKDDLQIEAWLKDLAPSTELRKWVLPHFWCRPGGEGCGQPRPGIRPRRADARATGRARRGRTSAA
jgi:Protein of unknown function, DUF488